MTIVSWVQLMLGNQSGDIPLTAQGLSSLKYFTVLSNLFSGIVSALYIPICIASGGAAPTWMLCLKLMATTAVTLTFATVVLLLGPRQGWKYMYAGGNLWMHLVLPLLAIADWCLFATAGSLSLWVSILGMLPTGLYAIRYVRLIMIHGAQDGDNVYDFYEFLRWGEDKIPVVLVAMLMASWGIAALLVFANHLFCLA